MYGQVVRYVNQRRRLKKIMYNKTLWILFTIYVTMVSHRQCIYPTGSQNDTEMGLGILQN